MGFVLIVHVILLTGPYPVLPVQKGSGSASEITLLR